MMYVVK
jgi:hypothetical protein